MKCNGLVFEEKKVCVYVYICPDTNEFKLNFL